MEPTIIQQAAFSVMGTIDRAEGGRHDYARLWGALDPYVDRLGALSTDGRFYGAHFPTEVPRMVDYVAGMSVPEGTTPLEGLVCRAVPAGTYAVFATTVGELHRVYAFVYGEWRPPQGHSVDHTRPDLEVYPPDSSGGPDTPVEVRVPLRRKGD